MKVCKFGGSSLADATQLNKVIDIVLADPARRIVVVSAPGKRDKGDTKVTDLLIALAKAALAGENVDRQLGAVVERYALIADELKLGEDIISDITRDLRSRVAQVKDLRPEEFLDLVKAAGEDNNAKLVAVAFAARGRKARYASPKDTGMVLKGEFGDATLDPDSYATLSRAFSNFEGIVIYPGFFGYTKDGKVATFPRGGSDITGSILAAAVCADVYENFTDVDSVYPCDPRIVEEVKDGEVVWDWKSIDYPELYSLTVTDAVATANDFANQYTDAPDYVHFNAMRLNDDGDLVCSFRHLNTITPATIAPVVGTNSCTSLKSC